MADFVNFPNPATAEEAAANGAAWKKHQQRKHGSNVSKRQRAARKAIIATHGDESFSSGERANVSNGSSSSVAASTAVEYTPHLSLATSMSVQAVVVRG